MTDMATRKQHFLAQEANGHVTFPWSDFEGWCRGMGAIPTSLGLPGMTTWRGGNVPAEVAQQWADLLSIKVEDIWPGPAAQEPKEPSSTESAAAGSGEPTEVSGSRGGTAEIPLFPAIGLREITRTDDTKRKADCRAGVVRAYRTWHDEMAAWLQIEDLNRSGIDPVNELVAAHAVLKKELRAIEAWFGALTFAEVLAGLVLDLTEGGPKP